jgi:hypothetical protein
MVKRTWKKERKKVERKLIQPNSKKFLPSDDHSIHWVVPKLAWNCTLVVASLNSDAAKLLFSAPPPHTHTKGFETLLFWRWILWFVKLFAQFGSSSSAHQIRILCIKNHYDHPPIFTGCGRHDFCLKNHL